MRSSKLILVGLLLSGAANAQSQGHNAAISQTDLGRIYEARNNENRMSNEPTTCLIRKSTHKRECRTRDGWKRLAQRMSASQTSKQ
jgi:hypothetical protein